MDDLISRQMNRLGSATSAFDISMKDAYAVKVERASLVAFRETLEYMPSAQPEIIRCKSCRHDNNCEIQYAAQAGSEFFCGAAERRKE